MRRNRRRLVLLSVVAAGNALIVFTILGGAAGALLVVGVPSIIHPSWAVSPRVIGTIAIVIGVVWLGISMWQVVHDLPAEVSGGLGVRPFEPDELLVPDLIEGLAIATGLPPPDEIGLLPSDAPNALALGVGLRRTAIVVTSGLLTTLTRDELEAVLASELIAAARLDTTLRTLLSACSHRARSAFDEWVPLDHWANPLFILWAIVFAPTQLLTALLWRSALARNGTEADALAIAVTRNPEALLHALSKLRTDRRELDAVPAVSVPLWIEPGAVKTRGRLPFAPVALARLLDPRITDLAELCGEPESAQ